MAKKSDRRSALRDRVRHRADETKHSGGSSYIDLPDGVTFFRPEEGTVELDFLPYEVTKDVTVPISRTKDMDLAEGDLNDRRLIFVHRGIGADSKSYLCPRTIKKACPICEERARLQKDYKANEDLIKDLNPQMKELFNVRIANDKKAEVQLFEFSYSGFGDKLDEEIREGKEDWGAFAALESGYTLRVRFKEETYNKIKFLRASRIDFDERDDIKDAILEEVVNLDECLVVLPYKELDAIFQQLDEHDEEEEDEKPTKRPSKKKDEEEEEEDEKPKKRRGRKDEEEEEEDEEPPSRRRERTSSRSKKKEEDEEEDEKPARRSKKRDEEEDEEEDEKPKKKAGKKSSDDDECPYEHEYGVDCDNTDDCDKCEKWDDCRDETDRRAKDKKKKR